MRRSQPFRRAISKYIFNFLFVDHCYENKGDAYVSVAKIAAIKIIQKVLKVKGPRITSRRAEKDLYISELLELAGSSSSKSVSVPALLFIFYSKKLDD